VNLNVMRRFIVFFAALVLGMMIAQVSESQSTRPANAMPVRVVAP